ncbi:MAG: AAA family ATPase, partial [Pirellulales bacterium]|nr:AAA family ATPase [Pirellulales bacterium]
MKITGIEVDGFGVWSELKIDPLPDGAMVVYGENEAGKTTLMQFVRSMLYGVSPERRARYLPPVNGDSAGGSLAVRSPSGSFEVRRNFSANGAGGAKMIASDGSVQSGNLLPTLMAGVDEAIFSNVFAVGLREI